MHVVPENARVGIIAHRGGRFLRDALLARRFTVRANGTFLGAVGRAIGLGAHDFRGVVNGKVVLQARRGVRRETLARDDLGFVNDCLIMMARMDVMKRGVG